MTNTNDFRRYSYANDPSYLINSFNVSRSAHAPALQPEPETERGFKVRENKRAKSKKELRAEQKSAFSLTVKIVAVAVISLIMIGLVVNSFAVKNELTRQISAKQTAIANAQSEHISLQSQLNSLVSMSMIDQYAVEELGMVKVKSNQIQYMDVDSFQAKREAALAKAADEAKQKEKQQAKSHK